MKKERTLKGIYLAVSVWTVLVPMLLFGIISQARLWKTVTEYRETQITHDLEQTDQTLDLIVERYATVLYDFCTNDDMVSVVEGIMQKEDNPEPLRRQLRNELIHICNRTPWVEGITLKLADGQIFFYDRMMASSVNSSWAADIEVPNITDGVVYHHYHGQTVTEDGMSLLFQISRRMVDYRDIDRDIATITLSVNARAMDSALRRSTDTDIYVCELGHIIGTGNKEWSGHHISEVPRDNTEVQSIHNNTTGWGIYVYQSRALYRSEMLQQMVLGIVLTLISVLVILYAMFKLITPIVGEIRRLGYCMGQVQEGNLSVRVDPFSDSTREIRQIADGFNQMVEQLEELIENVKTAVLDQKNAELSALEAQIDPHFLYNTLDTINWKALENEEYEISDMLGALADILRYTVRQPGATTSVGQELYWLKEYILLQNMKLKEPIEVITDVPEYMETCRMHKLLLQPFIENAVKHGFEGMEGPYKIKISLTVTDGQLHIRIADNGKGLDAQTMAILNDESRELEGHIGITNVRKRLKLYYGDDAAVYFESRAGRYTVVHLFLPVLQGEERAYEDSDSGGRTDDPQRTEPNAGKNQF